VAVNAETWLTGLALSIVFVQIAVLIGVCPSNTTDACSATWVPVARPGIGVTLKDTLAAALGGRNPTRGLKGGNPVVGSIDVKVQASVRVARFSFASTFTRRL
jgi:hypothetical protein